jgi:hypothetical protein
MIPSYRTISFAVLLLLASAGCGRQVKNIEIEPMSFSFNKADQTQKLRAVPRDSRGGPVEGLVLSFRSENERVAKVDSSGVVRPTGNGSTAIVVESHEGVSGEAFVKVCLPGELICEPNDKLLLRVGSGAPVRCFVTDCKGDKLTARVDVTAEDDTMLLKDDTSFIGLKVGNTQVMVSALGLTKAIPVQVDEQTFAPGMGPSTGGSGKGGRRGSDSQDGHATGGAYDHILKNMKVSPD